MDESLHLAKERTDLAEERTLLAIERTFSAWIRTGLAFVGGGIAILRVLTFEKAQHQTMAKISGVILIALGIVIFILAVADTLSVQRKFLKNARFLGSVISVSLIALLLSLISLWFIVITF